jgi:hypothetical protein
LEANADALRELAKSVRDSLDRLGADALRAVSHAPWQVDCRERVARSPDDDTAMFLKQCSYPFKLV